MQTEAQRAIATASLADSKPIKKQHGGKRAGSGRKPNLAKRLISGLKAATAAEILQSVDPEKVIKEIFAKGSLTLKQRTLADMWDRAYGRPAQNVNVAGGMLHAHTVWRPLASLSDEEIQLLNKFSQRMAAPSDSNASQNGSSFQVKSSAAIEAEVVRHRRFCHRAY